MSKEALGLTMVRGVIAGLTAEHQAEVKLCADEFRGLIKERGGLALMAFALVGAEIEAEG